RSSLSQHGCLFERHSDTPSSYGRLCVRVCSAHVPAASFARQSLSSDRLTAVFWSSRIQATERIATTARVRGPDSTTHPHIASFWTLVSLQALLEADGSSCTFRRSAR